MNLLRRPILLQSSRLELRDVIAWLVGNYDLPTDQVIRITLGIHLAAEPAEPIGFVSYGPLPEDEEKREIAYAIHPEHWGNGHATEAAAVFLQWVRASFGPGPIYASVDPGNTGSLAVLGKIGFSPVPQEEAFPGGRVLLRDGAGEKEMRR